jgi:hypothetical protein
MEIPIRFILKLHKTGIEQDAKADLLAVMFFADVWIMV